MGSTSGLRVMRAWRTDDASSDRPQQVGYLVNERVRRRIAVVVPLALAVGVGVAVLGPIRLGVVWLIVTTVLTLAVASRNGAYYALADDAPPQRLPQPRFDLTGYRVVPPGELAALRARLTG